MTCRMILLPPAMRVCVCVDIFVDGRRAMQMRRCHNGCLHLPHSSATRV